MEGRDATVEPVWGVMAAVAERGGRCAPVTAGEVAETLDCGRATAADRLDRLVDEDALATKQVGDDGRVWWRPRDDAAVAVGETERAAAYESLVRDVLESADVGVFVLDDDFDVAWVNDAIEQYFGLNRDAVVGRDKRDLVHAEIAGAVDDSAAFAETVFATYDDNTYAEEFECLVTDGDGRKRWLEHRSKPIETGRFAGGRVELYYDVTGQKRAEEALREEKAFTDSILDTQRDVVFAFSRAGDFRRWNDQLRAVTGYADAEIREMRLPEFVAPRAVDRAEDAIDCVLRDGESVTVEVPLVTGDGDEIPYEFSAAPLTDDDGTVVGLTGIGRDVSDQKARERELRRERDLVERVFEASPVAVWLFGDDGDLVRANPRGKEILDVTDDGYTAGDGTLLDADGQPLPFEETPLGRTLSTGKCVTGQEVQFVGRDGDRRWLSVTTRTLGDDDRGEVVVTADDVTRLKEQARRLERQRDELETELDEVFDRVNDAFYAVDDEFRFTYVNDRAAALLGHAETDLLGRTVWEVLDVAPGDSIRERFESAMATQEAASFERYSEPLGIWAAVRLYPSESGLSVYFTDVTDRKGRERALEEYRRWTRTLVENFPAGAVALVDQEMRYVTFAGAPEGDTDLTRADLEGQLVRDVLPPEIADVVVPAYEAALRGEPAEFEDTIDGRTYQFHFVPVWDDDGDVFAATAMSQDVTEREERERALREAKLQMEAATEAGAVGTWQWHVSEDQFVAGASFARTFGVDAEEAREGVSIDRFVSAIHEDDRDRVERKVEEAVASCGEYEAEYRVHDADGDVRWVVARGRVECDEDGNPVTFPGALTDITERKRTEEELERRRQQLAALNTLNGVVREVTSAVIDQSTREEIEHAVCDALAATDSYEFAWIGSVDPAGETVELRAEAGVDGYLDDVTVSVNPDDASSVGPTARAVRTHEMQVSQDVQTDPAYEQWRARAARFGYRSSAAIPVVHDGALYGVLNVYSARANAFGDEEREVVGQLGEVVGHAIAAVERKQALMSDEVVEVAFHIHDVFDALGVDASTGGRVAFEQAVPVGDGAFLEYGTASADAIPALEAMVATLGHWESLSVLDDDGDDARFELRLTEPPVLSSVAAVGGLVDTAVVEDGDYRMTIHLPPSAAVHQVVDAVQAAYPTAEMMRRRTVTRGGRDDVAPLGRAVADELTDRQRGVLEAAVHGGYFEWPREVNAEDLADSLGVSAPTLHQHMRLALGKVLEAVLAESQVGDG